MLSEEQEMVTTAYSHGVVQFVGKADLVATSKGRSVGNWFKGLVTNGIYGFLVANARPASAEYQMPMDTVLEMRVRYEI